MQAETNNRPYKSKAKASDKGEAVQSRKGGKD